MSLYNFYLNPKNLDSNCDVLIKLADALHVTTDELLGRDLKNIHVDESASTASTIKSSLAISRLCNQNGINKQIVKQLFLKIHEKFMRLWHWSAKLEI